MMDVYLAQIVRFDAWISPYVARMARWNEHPHLVQGTCETCHEWGRPRKRCDLRLDISDSASGSYVCWDCYIRGALDIIGWEIRCGGIAIIVVETADVICNKRCHICDDDFRHGWNCYDDGLFTVCRECIDAGERVCRV